MEGSTAYAGWISVASKGRAALHPAPAATTAAAASSEYHWRVVEAELASAAGAGAPPLLEATVSSVTAAAARAVADGRPAQLAQLRRVCAAAGPEQAEQIGCWLSVAIQRAPAPADRMLALEAAAAAAASGPAMRRALQQALLAHHTLRAAEAAAGPVKVQVAVGALAACLGLDHPALALVSSPPCWPMQPIPMAAC